jgi:hypothetical protein
MNTKYNLYTASINEIAAIDLFIAASGYEHRASYLPQNLEKIETREKIVLPFKSHSIDNVRLKNDKIFKELGFRFETPIDYEWYNIHVIFDKYFASISDKKEINVVIDYSSMMRLWYATIIKYFFSNCNFKGKVNLFFCYSKAKYVAPNDKEIDYTVNFDPLPGFNKLSIPNKPTVLIIGLGYEKSRAIGLVEYFDAQEVFLFYSDNSDYHEKIKEANKKLLDIYNQNIFIYPLDDLLTTKTILTNLCTSLLNDYRIVIAPCGPKPFTLLSFILALENSNIDTWRISGNANPNKPKCIPSGNLVTLKLEFEYD